jgi:hypothetical protein
MPSKETTVIEYYVEYTYTGRTMRTISIGQSE